MVAVCTYTPSYIANYLIDLMSVLHFLIRWIA